MRKYLLPVLITVVMLVAVYACVSSAEIIMNVDVDTQDGYVFIGVPFRVSVDVIAGADYSVVLEPVEQGKEFDYTYSSGYMTIYAKEPGEYDVVVKASMFNDTEEKRIRIKAVLFKPDVDIELLNEKDIFMSNLVFKVRYKGNEELDYVLDVSPRIKSIVGLPLNIYVEPNSIILGKDVPEVNVTYYSVLRGDVSGYDVKSVDVGLELSKYYFTYKKMFRVPFYYMVTVPLTVKFNVPVKLTVSVLYKGERYLYYDDGSMVEFPKVFAGERIDVYIVGKNFEYNKTLSYDEYMRFLMSGVDTLYFKVDSSTRLLYGCYEVVYDDGSVEKIAEMSVLGVPLKPGDVSLKNVKEVHCVGAVDVISLENMGEVNTSSSNMGRLFIIAFFGMFIGIVVYMRKKGGETKKVTKEESGEEDLLEGADLTID